MQSNSLGAVEVIDAPQHDELCVRQRIDQRLGRPREVAVADDDERRARDARRVGRREGFGRAP